MPASPRIWPSIRFSLLRQDVLISWRIAFIYPPRVYNSRDGVKKMATGEQARGGDAAHSGHHHTGHAHHHTEAAAGACCGGKHEAGDQEPAVAIDPVCGMRVDIATARHRFQYRGQEYLFCGGRCRERFEAEPERFLKPKEPGQKM